MNRYRIFLSSPGDVGREREAAVQVVERLKNRWRGRLELELYVWEHEPMLASRGDFQANIPQPADFDLVVCVLWSRLGTRLHPGRYQRPDGSTYSSGTEYEFETALAGFRANQRPDLLVYRRDEIPLFPASPRERRAALEQQWEALEQFCRKWFTEDDYTSLRLAFNCYKDLAQFEESLERHLQELLRACSGKDRSPAEASADRPNVAWVGESPYRGLQVFEPEHEAIFFGRTKERDEILGTLQARFIEERKPFVLIFGASGSGKSSLLRAGVMPWLCRQGVIDGVGLWRSLVFRPADHPGDLLEGLAAALLGPSALPEIGADGTDAYKLAELIQKNPGGVALLVKEALSRAAGEEQRNGNLVKQPVARLAVGLDQLEEIFTLAERFGAESRTQFVRAIGALVESGYGWVVATLRSDFFGRCEEISDLVELAKGKGQYRLLPPNAAQLGQIVRYPAEAAGVAFEENSDKGRLDERIRDDALRESGGLPLLEYALDELFRAGSSDGILCHTEYEALGGVEGALRKRAEDTFAQLQPWEREALDSVLRQIVRLGSGDNETLTRRVANYDTATAPPGAKGLVDAFIAARLLIADRDNSGARILAVAHEALFRVWPEISRWEKQNRDYLRMRGRLGAALARWIECNREGDYLLAPGRPLVEAEDLLKNYAASLEPGERSFIVASRAKAVRAARRRRLAVAAVIVLLTAIAAIAIWQWHEAVVQKALAVRNENTARIASRNADGMLNYLVYQLRDKLKPAGRLDIVADVQKEIETYYRDFGFNQEDPIAENYWSSLLQEEGDRLLAQGDLDGAKAKFQESFAVAQKLVKQAPDDETWQGNLASAYVRLGDIAMAQNDLTNAKAYYTSYYEALQKLAQQRPGDGGRQMYLAASYDRLGDVLKAQQDFAGAKVAYSHAFEIFSTLTKQDPNNIEWQRGLAIADEKLGVLLDAQGDSNGAKSEFLSQFEIVKKLVARDPANSDWQRDLAVSYDRVGDVFLREFDLDGAKADYVSALAIRQKLAEQDPSNSDWQENLAISYEKVGELLRMQTDVKGAKSEFSSEFEIWQKLSKLHPNDSRYEFSLAISYEKLGDTAKDEGDVSGAKEDFNKEFELWHKLTEQDAGNSSWQRGLSVSYEKLGNLLMDQGDLSGAKDQFTQEVAIWEKLAKQGESNPDWQHGLAIAYSKLGLVSVAQSDPAGAKRYFGLGVQILTKLIEEHGKNTTWESELEGFQTMLRE